MGGVFLACVAHSDQDKRTGKGKRAQEGSTTAGKAVVVKQAVAVVAQRGVNDTLSSLGLLDDTSKDKESWAPTRLYTCKRLQKTPLTSYRDGPIRPPWSSHTVLYVNIVGHVYYFADGTTRSDECLPRRNVEARRSTLPISSFLSCTMRCAVRCCLKATESTRLA